MSDIVRLANAEWFRLRDIRLRALRESPDNFLSSYEEERTYTPDRWRAEFDRGSWHVSIRDAADISLVGVTREPGRPLHECYLEYIWVAPRYRRMGIASQMLGTVIDDVLASGVQIVQLWVLDGNDTAVRFYERLGFLSTGESQPISARPGRSEEKMILALDGDPRLPTWRGRP